METTVIEDETLLGSFEEKMGYILALILNINCMVDLEFCHL